MHFMGSQRANQHNSFGWEHDKVVHNQRRQVVNRPGWNITYFMSSRGVNQHNSRTPAQDFVSCTLPIFGSSEVTKLQIK
jgi:hypothetical protein